MMYVYVDIKTNMKQQHIERKWKDFILTTNLDVKHEGSAEFLDMTECNQDCYHCPNINTDKERMFQITFVYLNTYSFSAIQKPLTNLINEFSKYISKDNIKNFVTFNTMDCVISDNSDDDDFYN